MSDGGNQEVEEKTSFLDKKVSRGGFIAGAAVGATTVAFGPKIARFVDQLLHRGVQKARALENRGNIEISTGKQGGQRLEQRPDQGATGQPTEADVSQATAEGAAATAGNNPTEPMLPEDRTNIGVTREPATSTPQIPGDRK